MKSCPVHNVVFDIGNVLVRWSPREIIRLTFGESADMETLVQSLYKGDIWTALNTGKLTVSEAKKLYLQRLTFSENEIERFFYYVEQTQVLIYGTSQLVERVKKGGYKAFALTDNINEIVAHLKKRYEFWPLFDGAIVSAEVGCMKPGKEIFNHLLRQYQLQAEECVFIDDVLANVEGAQKVGFHAIHFHNALQCEKELKELGLTL